MDFGKMLKIDIFNSLKLSNLKSPKRAVHHCLGDFYIYFFVLIESIILFVLIESIILIYEVF